MKEKHFPEGLNDGVLMAVSETGYTNDLLSYKWLKHFDSQTRPSEEGAWRILIMDGHGSHLTNYKEFVDYCFQDDVRISPFLLPAHSTHLLQPLDIGVFQSFKHYHQLELEDSIQYGSIGYKRADFLASFQKMRDRNFRPKVIRSAFRKAGLYPFNPLVVKSKLIEFSTPERTLGPEDSEQEEEEAFEINFKEGSTPYDKPTYNAYSEYISKKLSWGVQHGMPLSPTTVWLIEKREKANQTLNLSGKLAIEELFKRQQAEQEKVRPKGERHVQQFGTILVGDARLKTMARNTAEEARKVALHKKKEDSQRQKREKAEGVAERKLERLAKKEAKLAEKAAARARVTDLISL